MKSTARSTTTNDVLTKLAIVRIGVSITCRADTATEYQVKTAGDERTERPANGDRCSSDIHRHATASPRPETPE